MAPPASENDSQKGPGPRIDMRGITNFRDLGGFEGNGGRKTRMGLVFRSDGLHRAQPGDNDVLMRLGIAKVFDLRADTELAKDGIGDFAGTHAEHVHVPMVAETLNPFDTDLDWRTLNLRERYLDMLGEGVGAIRAIYREVADAGARPVVFHCSGGKDRTGVMAALLLSTCGVRREAVIEDYSRSQGNLQKLLSGYDEVLEERGLDAEAVAYLTSSPPERMEYTLAEVDRRWGSVAGYLESVGVDEALQDAVRARLLG